MAEASGAHRRSSGFGVAVLGPAGRHVRRRVRRLLLAAVHPRDLRDANGPLGRRPVDIRRRAAPPPGRGARVRWPRVARRQGHRPARHPGRLRGRTAHPESRGRRLRARLLPAHPGRPGARPGLRLRARACSPSPCRPSSPGAWGRGCPSRCSGPVGWASVPDASPRPGAGRRSGLLAAYAAVACLALRDPAQLVLLALRRRDDHAASPSCPAPGWSTTSTRFILFDLTTSLGFRHPPGRHQRRPRPAARTPGPGRPAAGQPAGCLRRPGQLLSSSKQRSHGSTRSTPSRSTAPRTRRTASLGERKVIPPPACRARLDALTSTPMPVASMSPTAATSRISSRAPGVHGVRQRTAEVGTGGEVHFAGDGQLGSPATGIADPGDLESTQFVHRANPPHAPGPVAGSPHGPMVPG